MGSLKGKKLLCRMGETKGLNALPQELIEEIVSRTSPAHACGKLSLLSKSFRSAAKSNRVWERFLPIDIISRRAVPDPDQEAYDDPWENIDSDTLHAFPTKKDLYLFLCDNPLYIDNGTMCAWLDKLSGNKCFHIGPMSLTLGHPDGWLYESGIFDDCRFCHAPILEQHGEAQNYLKIEGKICTSLLSRNTTYTAYLIFDYSDDYYCTGFGEEQPLETFVGIDGYGESENRLVYIPTDSPYFSQTERPAFIGPQYPVLRKGSILCEIELGSYLNKEGGDNRELLMSLREVNSGKLKGGIGLFGIEIRPRSSVKTS